MTVLDDILDASTDSTISSSDLLRKVQIAASRLGATEIVAWTRYELQGYPNDVDLPPYRHQLTSVVGHFTGVFQTWRNQTLTAVPIGMESNWYLDFREPLSELQALSDNETDPQTSWSSSAVQQYEESRVYWIEGMSLFTAWNVITRQSLKGMIDIVRTRAMEFALQLQADFPEAGSVGGPTVATTPELAHTVNNITYNITGHGTNIANGAGSTQTSTVNVGDEGALRTRLEELLVSEQDREEFVAAVQEERSLEGARTSGFLSRVRSGAIQLAAGLTTDVAAEILVSLGQSFLGM